MALAWRVTSAGVSSAHGGREQRPKERLPGIELETARHDAEHSVSPAVEGQRLADGAGRAAEQGLPSGIAEHQCRASIQVCWTKRAPLGGGHPEGFEEPRRDGFAQRAARVAAPGERILHPLPSGDAVEGAALAVEDFDIAIAGEHLGIPVAGGLPDGRQARRIAEGEGAQQDSVHQAEDQGISTDAQGQKQYDHRGEAGVVAQRAGGVTQIGGELAHGGVGPRYQISRALSGVWTKPLNGNRH
ncbi:MAG: hypothetical protein ABSG56_37605 [Bryobacteraceae bacterium]